MDYFFINFNIKKIDLKINFSIFCLIVLLHNAMIKRKKANAKEEKEIFDKLFEPI